MSKTKLGMRNTRTRRYLVQAVSFSIATFSAASVIAQEPGFSLEEIVVQAQKRTESAQDVPIALSAFSGEDLQASGVVELKDISKFAPGLVFESTSTSSQPLLYVRGIGTRQFQLGSDPSVGVFVDGVYVPRFTAQSMALLDVESVEVLKGPQGTIYGRNTIGGAINVNTRQPSDEFRASIDIGYGQGERNSNDVINIGGSISGPISDSVLYSLSASHAEDDGSVRLTNPLTGETGRGYGYDTDSILGKLVFSLSDTAELAVTASYQESDNSPRIFVPSDVNGIRSPGFPSLLNAALRDPSLLPDDPYDLETDLGVRGFARREITNLNIKFDWETPIGTLTSITSYTDIMVDEVMDGDATFYNAQSVAVQEDSETYAQEIRLAGESSDGRWTWLLGAYAYDDDATRLDIIGIGPDSRATDNPNTADEFADFAANPRDPFGVGINTPIDVFDINLMATGESVFGQFSYQFTDELKLTAGIRYSQDEKDAPLIATTELPMFGPFIGGNFTVDEPREGEWDSVDPMFSLSYDLNDDAMVYVSYRTGYKSGGFQDLNGNPTAQTSVFEPEDLTAIEVGIKSELFDRRVRLNASIFDYDYEDLQLQGPLEAGNPTRVTTNAADTSLNGLDLEIKALITEAFTLDLTYAYLDAEFEEYAQDLGATILEFAGTSLPQAPENKINLVGNYTVATDLGDLGFRLGITYTDDLLLVQEASNVDPGTGILGDSGLLESSRTTVDANISLAQDNWRASLYALNLTDQVYRVAAVEQQSNSALLEIYNQPRVIGVKLNYSF